MGAKSSPKAKRIDREIEPETIQRRTELFDQYVRPFFNMIYKLCIKYSFKQCNIEENYTEVLVNFYRRIETYDPSRSICTWLHICTKRYIFALERKRQRQESMRCEDRNIETFGEDDGDLCTSSMEAIPSDDKTSSNVMGVDNYRELYSDEILEVLDAMKSIHRDAFLLQEAGYSLEEIVEIEHNKGTLKSRSIETVKNRVFTARQFLKKHLTRDGQRIPCQADDEDIHPDCEQPNQP